MKIFIVNTGEWIDIDPNNLLTKDNLFERLEKRLAGDLTDEHTFRGLDVIMNFALRKTDLPTVQKVYERISSRIRDYFLDKP